ncbi:hypothetical protein HYC85_000322 [Camellia sinensis]|uniref:Uncharacterized protein n=1 Tax=Camellia sinensis TaxID=4442 RepID=A0A7J7I260_CAMSI|nr:hypothetical protein HYC85_000322 [Camellia sinensis]
MRYSFEDKSLKKLCDFAASASAIPTLKEATINFAIISSILPPSNSSRFLNPVMAIKLIMIETSTVIRLRFTHPRPGLGGHVLNLSQLIKILNFLAGSTGMARLTGSAHRGTHYISTWRRSALELFQCLQFLMGIGKGGHLGKILRYNLGDKSFEKVCDVGDEHCDGIKNSLRLLL